MKEVEDFLDESGENMTIVKNEDSISIVPSLIEPLDIEGRAEMKVEEKDVEEEWHLEDLKTVADEYENEKSASSSEQILDVESGKNSVICQKILKTERIGEFNNESTKNVPEKDLIITGFLNRTTDVSPPDCKRFKRSQP